MYSLQTLVGRRARLALLVLGAIVPFTAFITYQILHLRDLRTGEAMQRAHQYARLGADGYEDTIREARTLLEIVSQAPDAMTGTPSDCNRYLAAIEGARGWANGMWVVGGDGRVRCSTIAGGMGLDLSDREEYRRAIAARGFLVSDLFITKLRRVPAALATLPAVSKSAGEPLLLAVALDLSWFDRLSARVGEGTGATILLFDSKGTILSSYSHGEVGVGANFANVSAVRTMLSGSGGQFEDDGLDGGTALWGYVTLSGTGLRLAVNFDRALVLANLSRGTKQAAAIFGMVILVIGALIWFAGNRFFAEPMRELDDLLQATLQNMDQGLIVIDKHDTIPICNQRAIDLLGLPPELMRSRPRSETVLAFQKAQGEFTNVPQDVQARVQPRIHGEIRNVYERERPNGIVLEVRTAPFASGGVVRTLTDITARKNAERELAASEARYRLLADNCTDTIFKLNMQFACEYVSPACREILGYTSEELFGANPMGAVHPDDMDCIVTAHAALANGLDRIPLTIRTRHRDGHWIWLEAHLRLVREPATGLPSSIVGAFRDVSARKAAEDALESANRTLEILANSDGLTGLANRRYFDNALADASARAKRSAAPLALVMIDVDFFKAYNDHYGHVAGDATLQAVAKAVQAHLKRPDDIAARLGGEEIAVLLPDTDLEGAKHLAGQIRDAIRELTIEHAGAPSGFLTASAGVASIASSDDDPRHLVERADQALYKAKNDGRDRVEVAEGDGQSQRVAA